MRTAVKFDLSSIPANATVVTARLSLYSHPDPANGNHTSPNAGPDNSMLIQRITTPWVADSVKWLNQPSFTADHEVLIPATTLPSMDLIDINVKDMVSSMIRTNNYGFLIKLQTEVIYNSRMFCSSRYPDITKHPKLAIVYKID